METLLAFLYAIVAVGICWLLYYGVCKRNTFESVVIAAVWPLSMTVVTLSVFCKLAHKAFSQLMTKFDA